MSIAVYQLSLRQPSADSDDARGERSSVRPPRPKPQQRHRNHRDPVGGGAARALVLFVSIAIAVCVYAGVSASSFHGRLWAKGEGAERALRLIGWARCLQSVSLSRFGTEEIDELDVVTCSNRLFSRWAAGLNGGDRRRSVIYRCGAVSFVMRRQEAQACNVAGVLRAPFFSS